MAFKYGIYIGDSLHPARLYDQELLNPFNRQDRVPPEETVIAATYEMGMNEAGTLKFKIPRTHRYYADIRPLITEVIVVEIDNVVWFGRVLTIKTDWNNNLEATCEGALGYLNDSITYPRQFFNETPAVRFRHIIDVHNSQVPQTREMSIADISIDPDYEDREESGEDDYQTSYDAIKSLVNTYGGYLYCLMNALTGLPDIYWIASRDLPSAETVEYGKNLLDFKRTDDKSGIFTVLLPLGANVEVERLAFEDDGTPIMEWDEDTQQYTNVQAKERVEMPLRLDFTKHTGEADEDGFSDEYYTSPGDPSSAAFIEGSYLSTYGNIVRTVQFVDAKTIADLRTKAQTWLNEHELGGVKLDVDAQDMRFLNPAAGRFYLGMTVTLTSAPHGIQSQSLIITRIDADIKKLTKKITLGELPGKTISDLVGRDTMNFQVGKPPSTQYHKVRNKYEMKSNHAEEGVWYIPL